MQLTPHFTAEELACRCGCGQYRFNVGFLDALEALRVYYGKLMTPTSCCRCEAHNRAIGGHPKSLHKIDNPNHDCHTMAIDIVRPHPYDLHRLIDLASDAHWSIRVYNSFIHLDRRFDIGKTAGFWTIGGTG